LSAVDDEPSNLPEYYQSQIDELEEQNRLLKEENKRLREELVSLKTTLGAVVARSINAKKDTAVTFTSTTTSDNRKYHKKSGRRKGHEGGTRRKPDHVDHTMELDQTVCPKCGGTLSEKPTDKYERFVEDVVPAKVVVTRYVIKRRYCRGCRKQISPEVPNVLSSERFGLRLMLLIVSLKLLGLSYAKITSLFKLIFNLEMSEASAEHSVMKIADAFGPQYTDLISELRNEKSLHGDETSWRIKGKNHWLWAFVGKWSVIYEVARSRGSEVPIKVLGRDYAGTVISDSWPAWNYVGTKHQRCLLHYLRDIEDTQIYKRPGKEFQPFSKKLERILNDAIKVGKGVKMRKDRLRAKKRFEARIEKIITSYAPSDETNCMRFVKRLKREKGMLFTFLEELGVDWNNNTAERAIRPSVVIRKITYGNQSMEGADAHKVLMSVKETCKIRGLNFYDYALNYLNPASKS